MENLKQDPKEAMIRLIADELPNYEYVDMYCGYPATDDGKSWHLVLKNKQSDECVTVTAGTCLGRPSPYNAIEFDYEQHDVEWGQDGLWDEYDCFEQDEIEDPDLAEFLYDWTYDIRKYISECEDTDNINDNRQWAESLVGETIKSVEVGTSQVSLKLSNDEVLTIKRQPSQGRS